MDGLGQGSRFEFHLLPSATRDAPTGDFEELLAAAIVDEGDTGVVKATAIGLEDQPLRAPKEVGHEAPAANLKRHVDLRLRQTELETDMQEHPLELAPAVSVLRMDFICQQPEASDAAPPTPSTNLASELALGDQSPHFRLPERLPQIPWRQRRRLIQEGAGDGGAGHPAINGSIGRRKEPVPMSHDAFRAPPTPIRSDDVNLP